jgi:hypothetical protein
MFIQVPHAFVFQVQSRPTLCNKSLSSYKKQTRGTIYGRKWPLPLGMVSKIGSSDNTNFVVQIIQIN